MSDRARERSREQGTGDRRGHSGPGESPPCCEQVSHARTREAPQPKGESTLGVVVQCGPKERGAGPDTNSSGLTLVDQGTGNPGHRRVHPSNPLGSPCIPLPSITCSMFS